MAHDMKHLKQEIESLEKQLSTLRFGGLFDRKRVEQLEDKLRKKRKELALIVAGDDDDLDGADHIDIPEIDVALVEAPDLDADFGVGPDQDEPIGKSKASATKSSKPAAKTAAKPVKKVASKPKPAAKPQAKPKPVAKKKTASKPAKKKSKR
jgi:outer membrane biosynthesis protein TonB